MPINCAIINDKNHCFHFAFPFLSWDTGPVPPSFQEASQPTAKAGAERPTTKSRPTPTDDVEVSGVHIGGTLGTELFALLNIDALGSEITGCRRVRGIDFCKSMFR